jgi:hypothetical protein
MTILLAVFLSSFNFAQETEHDHSDPNHTHENKQSKSETLPATHTTNRVSDQQIDSILKANLVSLEHAESFNKLVIQDAGGRMKPAHTFASELVRKVTQTENFNGMKPSQVLLSIIENGRLWYEVPAMYLEKQN